MANERSISLRCLWSKHFCVISQLTRAARPQHRRKVGVRRQVGAVNVFQSTLLSGEYSIKQKNYDTELG